ncbi:flavin-containing monooxygenase [Collimonas humicola]|uniref:flavin-containing monooxygenase n=1 Tax=Collimonas humicola TaxID=2825886 RepID=UPI001B8C6081|nr:NAD(P)-binding domain-containing protein [Collimonas humicola]
MSASSVSGNNAAVCIIGGGPGGLSAARALKRQGVSYEQFERHSDVGGIWDMNNPGSPMYESAHFISSRDQSGYADFPMPKDYPDYPTNQQIVSYVRSFARAFGLYDNIRFGVSVRSIDKLADGRWQVTLENGEQRRYGAVICATGCNWDPSLPEIKGQFNGEIRHSVTYKRGEEFKGKRVMVVGAGNSGADISCDAATYADSAFISMRRGYHFIPKHLFGVPSDEFAEKGPQLPMWMERPVFSGILKMITGDLTRFGLPKPDHKLFESHPLMNTQLLHHLQHGNIAVRPDVERYDGDEVVFKDGSREQLDLVLYATGYKWSAPYAGSYFEWQGGRPQMYLSVFNRAHRNLFGIGYIETNSSAFKLFDAQAHLIASYLRDQFTEGAGPERVRAFDELIAHDDPDLSGGIKFIKSQRHTVYLEVHALKRYLKKLHKRIGWPALRDGDYAQMLKPQPEQAPQRQKNALKEAA